MIAFDIATGTDPLRVVCEDVIDAQNRTMIGSCEIDLRSLSAPGASDRAFLSDTALMHGDPNEIDQMKRDNLHDLKNAQGEVRGQIRLSLQWIYSKAKLLEDMLRMMRVQIQNEAISKETFEKQLNEMEQPFGNMLVI